MPGCCGESFPPALAQQATLALRARFPDASVGYYEPDGGLWKVRVWTDDLPEVMVAQLTAGLPSETLMIAEVLRAQRTVFADAWQAEQAKIEHLGDYAVVANSPLIVKALPGFQGAAVSSRESSE